MQAKQNISIVLDDCCLSEDAEQVVAARSSMVGWYSRSAGMITAIVERYLTHPIPSGNGAVTGDGVFVYYAPTDDRDVCIAIYRDKENALIFEPEVAESVPRGYKFVGFHPKYTSWGCFANSTKAVTVDLGDAILAGRGTVCVTIEDSTISIRDMMTGDISIIGEREYDTPVTAQHISSQHMPQPDHLFSGWCVCYDNTLWIGNSGHYVFDTPIVSVWASPVGIIAIDSDTDGDPHVWVIKPSESTCEQADDPDVFLNYEWVWYNSAHDDHLGLDVSGRVCVI